MRLNLLSYASGLGVIAGALLWPTPSSAQGFCYMVDTDGTVINLDSLCLTDTAPAPSEPQADTTGAGEVQQPSPTTRSFTITGPPSIPGSGQAPLGAPPPTQAPGVGAGSTTPQPTTGPSVVTPTTPQVAPAPGVVTPTTPQVAPAPGVVTPTTPQVVPAPGVAPAAP